MKLESLTLANCGGFEQGNAESAPPVIDFESDLTLITGVNGVGKSTILRSLAVVLSRAMPEFTPSRSAPIYFTNDDIHSDRSSLAVSVRLAIDGQTLNAGVQRLRDADEQGDRFVLLRQPEAAADTTFADALQGRTLTGDLDAGVKETRAALAALKSASRPPLAVYFTPKRQLSGQPRTLSEAKPFETSIAYGRALNDRAVELREFMHWFRTQEKLGAADEPSRLRVLNALRRVVTELVPEFSNLRIQEQPRLGFVVDKRGQPFYLHQLSDGERGLLALVFDLTRRLAIANPAIDDPIAEGVALVLIDEIELHLHPKWQRDVTKRLPTIFKNCQFVITTHSPQVIGEVEARCVRLLSLSDGRIAAETPAMALGTDSNWILNVLMGADEMDEEIEKELHDISTLIAIRSLEKAKNKLQELRKRLGNTGAIQQRASIIERIERLGR